MKIYLLILPLSFFFCQCTSQTSTVGESTTKQNGVHLGQAVIEKTLPSDTSLEKLFATLPYFQGSTYEERLKVVRKGTAVTGSLKGGLYSGSFDKPYRFIFKDNGFGEEVEITTLHEGDLCDFDIDIRDLDSKKLKSIYATYGTFYEGISNGEKYTTPRWFF